MQAAPPLRAPGQGSRSWLWTVQRRACMQGWQHGRGRSRTGLADRWTQRRSRARGVQQSRPRKALQCDMAGRMLPCTCTHAHLRRHQRGCLRGCRRRAARCRRDACAGATGLCLAPGLPRRTLSLLPERFQTSLEAARLLSATGHAVGGARVPRTPRDDLGRRAGRNKSLIGYWRYATMQARACSARAKERETRKRAGRGTPKEVFRLKRKNTTETYDTAPT